MSTKLSKAVAGVVLSVFGLALFVGIIYVVAMLASLWVKDANATLTGGGIALAAVAIFTAICALLSWALDKVSK